MLSVATVRSAKGASAYFAADNYYTAGDAEAAGEWVGRGAAALGLAGKVDQATFEALLRGTLPGGSQVGVPERHAAGTDLTFSLPKSWSLLALVGGDRRIIMAYREAVRETLAWAERNAAETRMGVAKREKIVPTGNLVVALFEHDTSRAQDPQAHLHAVVANVTQGPDGKWRALHNGKLWQLNTLLNAIAMAAFRERVEALGYQVGERSKHGNFEVAGLPRNLLMAFSARRQQILAKVAEMGAATPAAFDAATLMTRPDKAPVSDRAALYTTWRKGAAEVGLDLAGTIAAADRNVRTELSGWARLAQSFGSVATKALAVITDLRDRLGLRPNDPYLRSDLAGLGPAAAAATHAVASALRHLEQREAAFAKTDLYKAALDTGLPTTIEAVERRVAALLASGTIAHGTGRREVMVTTALAIGTETAILDGVERGRGEGRIYCPAGHAAAALQEAANAKTGHTLNPGQRAAGTLLLASPDRIIAIQGVAGAGKSSVLAPAADLIRTDGTKVLGLAVQNTLVQMLQREVGIPSMTIARFLKAHGALLGGPPDRTALAQARHDLGGAAILVDEASMLSNKDQLDLVRLANLIGVGRLAFVGDARQLGAVDAGKPFSIMQQAGAPTAQMSENLRARSEAVRTAAAAAQIGAVDRAMEALRPFTVEAPDGVATEAAARWLALPGDERERTAIYASGRRLRSAVNAEVQGGLLARSELGPGKREVTALERVSLTDEELRYPHNYAEGMVIEISRAQRDLRLPRARATVENVDQLGGTVTLRLSGGTTRVIKPAKLRVRDGGAPFQLYQPKTLSLHEGERIRWTANDHGRGLFNADQARISGIENGRLTVETSQGLQVTLQANDPMLSRLDLAYALNAHMAQGLTADRGIAVMETRDTKLVNQQTFLVTITRLRDALTLIVDKPDKIERQLSRNPGGKASALETTGQITERAKTELRREARLSPEKAIEIEPARSKPYDLGI